MAKSKEREVEQVLQESEQRFRLLADSIQDGITIIEEGQAVYVNERLSEILGYSRDELMRMKGMELTAPEERERLQTLLQAAQKEGRLLEELEYWAVRKDGSRCYVRNRYSMSDETEGVQRRFVVTSDITEQKQSERELQRSEERFRDVALSTSDWVWEVDVQGRYTYCSERVVDALGYTAEEILGKTPFDLMPPNEAARVGEIFGEIVANKQPIVDLENVNISKDGQSVRLLTNGVPILDEADNLIGYRGVDKDITERKRLEERQARMASLYSQFNELQTELLAPAPLEDKLKQVTDWTVDYVGADFARIWVIEQGDLCEDCMHAQVMEGDRHICLDKERCLHLRSSSGRYTHIDGEVHRRVPFGAYKIGRVAGGVDDKFLTNDVPNDPRVHNLDWARELDLVSFAGYKLSTPEEGVLGVFALFSQQTIPPEEDALLESIASAISLTIRASALEEERAKMAEARAQELHEIAQRRAEEVRLNTEVAQEVAGAPALDELYNRVVTLVKERFGYYHVQIFRHDPDVDAMVVVEGYGEAGAKMKASGHSLPYGTGVVGTAAATGKPVLAADVTEDPNWVPHPELPKTQAELAVPIKLRDEVLGVLDVQSDEAGALTEEDQVLLLGLAGQIASAIESTQALEQAGIFRQFAETTGQGMGMATLDGQVIYVNPTLCGILGLDRPEDAIGQTFARYYAEEVQQRLQKEVMPAVMQEGQWTGELALISATGKEVPTLENFFVIRDDRGEPRYLADVMTDITRRKAAETEREQLLAQTEALYAGSEKVVRSANIDDALQALVESTALQQLDRVSVALFDRPWQDEPPEEVTIVAAWERGGGELREPVGTHYAFSQFPVIDAITADHPAILRDITTDERVGDNLRALLVDRLGMRSMGLWPLVVGGQWIGMLTGQSAAVMEIEENEERQIASLVDQAAAVIQTQRLFEQTEATLAETEMLYNASRALIAAENSQEMLQAIAQPALELGAHIASLTYVEVDAEGQPEWSEVVASIGGTALVGTRFYLPEVPQARLLLANPDHPLLIADVDVLDETADGQIIQMMKAVGTHATAVLPLRVGQSWQGMVSISWPEPHEFSPKEEQLFGLIGPQLAARILGLRLRDEAEHRALWLQTAAEVSHAASTILEPNRLMQQVVDLVRDRFGLYYAGLFLVGRAEQAPGDDETDEAGDAAGRGWAILRVGTGEAGRQMVENGHKLEIGGQSMIGQCLATRLPRVAMDVGQEAVRFENPLLPDTRTELALPLVSRGQPLGALTIQSVQTAAFSEEDISVLQTMTDQLAITIDNVNLIEQAQSRAEREQRVRTITDRIRRGADAETIMRVTLEELSRMLGTSKAVMRLGTQAQLGGEPDDGTDSAV